MPSQPFTGAIRLNATNDSQELQQALSLSRNLGVARLEEIARREAPLLGLSFPTTINYLSINLQYHLGNAERCGLRLFYELAAGLGLPDTPGVELKFQAPAGKSFPDPKR